MVGEHAISASFLPLVCRRRRRDQEREKRNVVVYMQMTDDQFAMGSGIAKIGWTVAAAPHNKRCRHRSSSIGSF
jgi:hypothetical protein